ncbi:MAG: DUF3515 domain-containing protein [Nakamurella sp.]
MTDPSALPGAAGTEPAAGGRLPTWRLMLAIALPVIAIVAVVVLAAVVNSRPVSDVTDPLPVSSVEAPGATTASCTELIAALPDPLGQLPRRELVRGEDPLLAGVAAWGEPAVVLRCGVPTPTELTCSAPVQVVNGVTWLLLGGGGATTYLAVDRAVRVALTVPDSVTSTGPWQEISSLIGATLPARDICVNGEPVPPDGG